MNNTGNPFHSVTFENTYSPDPVTAAAIHVQSVTLNRNTAVSKSDGDDTSHVYESISPKRRSPYFENGVLRQGLPCNGACKSSAPFLEQILADEELGVIYHSGVDPYVTQPPYNPWYKPFAKRAQQQPPQQQQQNVSTTFDDLSDFLTTYHNRPHNSWSHGECLGTIIIIVIFIAVFVYIIMGLSGHFSNGWHPFR